MFDPEKVSRQSHPNWRFPATECTTVWDMYRAAQVVLATDYDQLLELYKTQYEENIRLLNDASIWRNRAIDAEEELKGANRLVGLREGFER